MHKTSAKEGMLTITGMPSPISSLFPLSANPKPRMSMGKIKFHLVEVFLLGKAQSNVFFCSLLAEAISGGV
jgi:hypothetical protein